MMRRLLAKLLFRAALKVGMLPTSRLTWRTYGVLTRASMRLQGSSANGPWRAR